MTYTLKSREARRASSLGERRLVRSFPESPAKARDLNQQHQKCKKAVSMVGNVSNHLKLYLKEKVDAAEILVARVSKISNLWR